MAVKGTLKDFSFVELLQVMHMSRKTGRLEISLDNKWAMVIFRDGVVWHVEPRGFRGAAREDILFELIGWQDGTFAFQRVQVLPALERTVNLSTESLIMEGAKRIDDNSVVAKEMGDTQLAALLKFKPGAEAKVRYVPQNVKRVLLAINGQRSVGEVIKQSQLEAPQAVQIIKELIAQGVVESVDPRQNAASPV